MNEKNIRTEEAPENKPPQSHEHYAFGGRIDEIPEYRDYFGKNFKQLAHERLASEMAKTPEQYGVIQEMQAAIIALGEDIGVDLRTRMPDPAAYHLFPSQEAYSVALDELGESPDSIVRLTTGCLRPAGILQVTQNDKEKERSSLTHETLHEVSKKWIDVTDFRDDDSGTTKVDLNIESGFGYLNPVLDEMMTDIATIDVLEGAGYETSWRSYDAHDAIGAEIMRMTAERYGITSREMYRMLLKDKCNGSEDGIELLKETLGEERFEYLATIPLLRVDYPTTMVEAAQYLGLPEAATAIQAMMETKRRTWRAPWE